MTFKWKQTYVKEKRIYTEMNTYTNVILFKGSKQAHITRWESIKFYSIAFVRKLIWTWKIKGISRSINGFFLIISVHKSHIAWGQNSSSQLETLQMNEPIWESAPWHSTWFQKSNSCQGVCLCFILPFKLVLVSPLPGVNSSKSRNIKCSRTSRRDNIAWDVRLWNIILRKPILWVSYSAGGVTLHASKLPGASLNQSQGSLTLIS